MLRLLGLIPLMKWGTNKMAVWTTQRLNEKEKLLITEKDGITLAFVEGDRELLGALHEKGDEAGKKELIETARWRAQVLEAQGGAT